MDDGERERATAGVVHAAFLASVGVFALALWFARRSGGAPPDPAGRTDLLALALLALGALECVAADRIGRFALRKGPGNPVARVRVFFVVRFGAAEAAAVFGLMLGFAGGGPAWVLMLFALSVAALLFATPSREAWAAALAIAAPPKP